MSVIAGVGIDVAGIDRFVRWAARYEAQVLAGVFTRRERDEAAADARGAGVRLAESFAAKEAVGKALGTGLAGIEWSDIELRCAGESEALAVDLRGSALRIAEERGIRAWTIEIEPRESFVVVSAIGAQETLDPASIKTARALVASEPIARSIARWGERFAARVLDASERPYVAAHPDVAGAMAARIAVRRAARSVLGSARGVAVQAGDGRAPRLHLDARAAERARLDGVGDVHLSISHAAQHSAALVVFELRRRTCCSV